ncbi:hypothetical protein OH77DRAFT_1585452 [Trametes cingulata]|nr:hypothetical protein OH77DRAFT_1585452 [Trametes cingulata]
MQHVDFAFYDVSFFELFILTAEPTLLDRLLAYFGPHDIARVRALSRRSYYAMESYRQRAWNIDAFLSEWFTDLVLPQFYDKLDEFGAVVTGSSAIQFLARRPPIKGSDLDILVPYGAVLGFGRWFQRVAGYVYKPRGRGPYTSFDFAALSIPLRIDHLAGGAQADDPLSFGAKFAVFDFFKHLGNGPGVDWTRAPRVQLIAVVGDVYEQVLSFHSTAVMNIITGRYAASFFPYSTFVENVSWVCNDHKGYRGYGMSWREKYESRGFRVVDDRSGAPRERGNEFRPRRWIGDPGTWIIQFEDRDAPERALQPLGKDLRFEVVTCRRGPVSVGCYMNLAPHFSLSSCAYILGNGGETWGFDIM